MVHLKTLLKKRYFTIDFFTVDAPIYGASFCVERNDLVSKLRKSNQQWRWSQLFSGKKSLHNISDSDPSNLIITRFTHFERPFHQKTQKQPILRHSNLFPR